MERLMHEIHDYWEKRAESYSDYNKKELQDDRHHKWKHVMLHAIEDAFPGKDRGEIRILDAGAGPGLFSLLLAYEGFRVTALDCSENMLKEAAANAGDLADKITWKLGDVEKTGFEDMSFDVIVTRNVTWNLRHPKEAYREWFRLLDSGGLLLNFDANWYSYLYSEEKQAEYDRDRKASADLGIDDSNIGDNFEKMEEIAHYVPLSRIARPAWDVQTLKELGYAEVAADERIWEIVLSEEEKVSWASTPMFMIAARKDNIKERVARYWGKRSVTFLEQRRTELHAPINDRWLAELGKYIKNDRPLKILDVGCGAGYFSILLARQGHELIGIDLTPEMIEDAKILAAEEGVICDFRVMDAENPEFAAETFDVVISRNLTWTLPHPDKAYAEWLRILKPGGLLLNVDANYGKDDSSRLDLLPKTHAHHMVGVDLLNECEAIKHQLPISFRRRPAWDMDLLGELDVDRLTVDYKISKRIYTEMDVFYNPTPIFLLAVTK